MKCNKCKRKHDYFKNGKMKKTCPKQKQKGRGENETETKVEVEKIPDKKDETLIGNIKTGITNIYNKGLEGALTDRPKSVQRFLNTYGDQRIKRVTICRVPLEKMIKKVINWFSLGVFEEKRRELAYDDVYHLYAILLLQDGTKVHLEKNERVKITTNDPPKKDKIECITVAPRIDMTLNELFIQTEKKLGKHFYHYTAHQYNCQNFIDNLVKTLGINQSKFILQNTHELIPKHLRSFGVKLLDAKASLKYVMEGGKKKRNKRKKKNDLNNQH